MNLQYADKHGLTLVKMLETEMGGISKEAAGFMFGMKIKPYEEIAKLIERAVCFYVDELCDFRHGKSIYSLSDIALPLLVQGFRNQRNVVGKCSDPLSPGHAPGDGRARGTVRNDDPGSRQERNPRRLRGAPHGAVGGWCPVILTLSTKA